VVAGEYGQGQVVEATAVTAAVGHAGNLDHHGRVGSVASWVTVVLHLHSALESRRFMLNLNIMVMLKILRIYTETVCALNVTSCPFPV